MTAAVPGVLRAQALVKRFGQHGVRAEFEEQVEPGGDQGVGCRSELDRLAEVAAPIGSVELFAVERRAGDGRVERNRGLLRSDTGEGGDQFVPQRLHLRTMEGDLPAEDAVEDVALGQRSERLFERCRFAGPNGRFWPVNRGQRQPVVRSRAAPSTILRRSGQRPPSYLGRSAAVAAASDGKQP